MSKIRVSLTHLIESEVARLFIGIRRKFNTTAARVLNFSQIWASLGGLESRVTRIRTLEVIRRINLTRNRNPRKLVRSWIPAGIRSMQSRETNKYWVLDSILMKSKPMIKMRIWSTICRINTLGPLAWKISFKTRSYKFRIKVRRNSKMQRRKLTSLIQLKPLSIYDLSLGTPTLGLV